MHLRPSTASAKLVETWIDTADVYVGSVAEQILG